MPYIEAGPHVVSDVANRMGNCTRRFGVELEVSEADNWNALERDSDRVFGIKSDGSVSGDGLEFYSPILQGDPGIEAVENLCAYASENGWNADESCGYHLHIDCSDLNGVQKKRVYYAYKLTEKLWHRFVPSDRLCGSWCHPIEIPAAEIRNMTFTEIRNRVSRGEYGRYIWANICSLSHHRTIEIRLHNGTVDSDAVVNWIKAHVMFLDKVKDMLLTRIDRRFLNKTVDAQFSALETMWGDADLSAYYRRRAARTTRALNIE